MTDYSAKPATGIDWPDQEDSPYVDWWTGNDYQGGQRDAGSFGELTVALQPYRGDAQAYVVVPPNGERHLGQTKLPLWSQALPAGKNGQGMVFDEVAAKFGDNPPPETVRPAAIAVIIDMATNPLHDHFRKAPDKTRILAHWQMDAAFDSQSKRVPFGREFRQAEIDPVLSGGDELAALQALRLIDLSHPFAPRGPAHRDAHGTHVLDLFAGTDPRDDGATAAALRGVPILSVGLPSDRLMSAQGVFLAAFVDLALSWVEQRLADLFPGSEWPKVILNLSYGLAAGPKDGTDQLPKRIRTWAAGRVNVFMPAGNDGKSIEQAHDFGKSLGHAVLTGATGRNRIHWKVMPADPYSAYAELWLTGDAKDAKIRLTDPMGNKLTIGAMKKKKEPEQLAQDLVPTGGTGPVARIYRLGPLGDNGRRGFVLAIAPTHNPKLYRPRAEAGFWTVSIEGGAPDLRGDLHLQSERPLEPRYRLGHASRLVPMPGGPEPQRAGTLNAVTYGAGATVVDATRTDKPTEVVNYSSAKYGDSSVQNPKVVLQSAELSTARQYVRAAGHVTGSQTVVRGTSFAAALASHAALCAALGATPIRP